MKKEYLTLLNKITLPLGSLLPGQLIWHFIAHNMFNTAFCQLELDIQKTEELLENLKELKEMIKGEL